MCKYWRRTGAILRGQVRIATHQGDQQSAAYGAWV